VNPFSRIILNWYAQNGRDLPWRRTRDPYAVWLSEIILQQTRIVQGKAYWERFMERFPTVEDLAEASEDEVLRLWEGLGYYSRARNLHAAAKQIVALGGFPDTLEGIRSLKGVGDYTAAAIGSICFGLPAAVVDGNVYRVLARHFGISTPVGTTQAKKEFTALAQKLLPEDASAFNQGMMDFGALQCTPQNPDCAACPLLSSCNAYKTGRTEMLPVKKPATAVQERRFNYIYVRCNGYTAIRKRGKGDIWQGLYEPLVTTQPSAPLPVVGNYFLQGFAKNQFPTTSTRPTRTEKAQPSDENYFSQGFAKNQFSSDSTDLTHSKMVRVKADVKHQLTHRTLITDFYLWEPKERPELPEGYFWIKETELDQYAKPRLFEMLIEAIS
jgi:A/G-specific adenine glycosylase